MGALFPRCKGNVCRMSDRSTHRAERTESPDDTVQIRCSTSQKPSRVNGGTRGQTPQSGRHTRLGTAQAPRVSALGSVLPTPEAKGQLRFSFSALPKPEGENPSTKERVRT